MLNSPRHQLLARAGLGFSDNDDNPDLFVPVFVDVNGSPVPSPLIIDPVSGDWRYDPAVLVLQNRSLPGFVEDDGGLPFDNTLWEATPGVQSGAIPRTSNALIVVTQADMRATGILDVSPILTAQQRADQGTYVGPARPATLPHPVDTPTQTFTPYPTPAPAPSPSPRPSPSPPPSPAPAPSPSPLPSPAFPSGMDTYAPDNSGAGAPATAPAAGKGGILALAALALLFFN